MSTKQKNEGTTTPRPVLEVAFARGDLHPERVPLSTLSRVLEAIHRIAAGTSSTKAGEGDDPGPFQLLKVRRGSAVYALAGNSPEPAISKLRIFGEFITDPEYDFSVENPRCYLGSLKYLSRVSAKLDCPIIIRLPGKAGEELARVEPDSYRNRSHSMFITGQGSIAGTVKGVGGATKRRCRLRVGFMKRLLYCSVSSKSVIRQLGKHLYGEVVVEGEATWIKSTFQLLAFKIESVRPVKSRDYLEAMNALRAAGGSGWDDVDDTEAFLRDLRGDA